jgi:hypothetical protein
MNRREFIGGTIAGAVAAGLPAVGEPVELFGPTLYQNKTIPEDSFIFFSTNSTTGTACFIEDGHDWRVEVEVVNFPNTTFRNTGKVISCRKLEQPAIKLWTIVPGSVEDV